MQVARASGQARRRGKRKGDWDVIRPATLLSSAVSLVREASPTAAKTLQAGTCAIAHEFSPSSAKTLQAGARAFASEFAPTAMKTLHAGTRSVTGGGGAALDGVAAKTVARALAETRSAAGEIGKGAGASLGKEASKQAVSGAGYVSVCPTGRFFEIKEADGKVVPFVPIGHDEMFGFFMPENNPAKVQDRFLAHMKANGQNTIVVQLENELKLEKPMAGFGHDIRLEFPLGHYNERIAKRFDQFLDRAAKHKIQVVTYLHDTFGMDFHWERSPYNKVNGGPCTYVSDMLRDPEAIAAQKAKLDWFMKRYGNHPNVMAIELMNEIEWAVSGPLPGNHVPAGVHEPAAKILDGFSDPQTKVRGAFRTATGEEMKHWVDEISTSARDSYRKYWGDPEQKIPGELGLGHRRPLLGVSTNDPRFDGRFEGGANAEWLHRHPGLDFMGFHGYSWADGSTTNPKHPMDIVLGVRDMVRTNYSRIDPANPRPFLDTENGPLGYWIENFGKKYQNDRQYQRLMNWSNSTNGAAGPGMRWPYPNYGFGGRDSLNPLSRAMEKDLAAQAKVMKHVDWRSFQATPSTPSEFEATDVLMADAVRDRNQLFGHLVRDPRTAGTQSGATTVKFGGFAPGQHDVRWFDTLSGRQLSHSVQSGSNFVVETPSFDEHIAVVVTPFTPAT
ncbi:MAG: (1-4)-beta-mannan endohydrolase [Thermoleophilia bacterium]|nr:(1-4)-beta-mannan endohydrolase [Thermoleophilia bacterium]